MLYKSPLLPLLFFLLLPTIILAGNNQEIIEQLGLEIEQANDNISKSSFFIFRARQYTRIKKYDLALADYNQALELNHQGWIHLERSHFLLAEKKYALAYEDARAAKKEVPTLTREADKVIDTAVAEIRKQYEADNPPTIIMDTVVDPHRKTRFDVMRETGVMAAAARRIDDFNKNKSAKRKQQSSVATTPPTAPRQSRG